MIANKIVKVSEKTKLDLDALKVHHRETYEDVIRRLLGEEEEMCREQ